VWETGVDVWRAGSATVSADESVTGLRKGEAQRPQKRLLSGLSVAQVGQRTIGGSVARNSRTWRNSQMICSSGTPRSGQLVF